MRSLKPLDRMVPYRSTRGGSYLCSSSSSSSKGVTIPGLEVRSSWNRVNGGPVDLRNDFEDEDDGEYEIVLRVARVGKRWEFYSSVSLPDCFSMSFQALRS